MEEGESLKEVKTPAKLVVYRTTLLSDQCVLACGFHQGIGVTIKLFCMILEINISAHLAFFRIMNLFHQLIA